GLGVPPLQSSNGSRTRRWQPKLRPRNSKPRIQSLRYTARHSETLASQSACQPPEAIDMKRTLLMLGFSSLVLASAMTANADIARPKPSASPESEPKQLMNTGLQIVPDSKVYQAHLQISQHTLKELVDAANAGATNRSFTERLAHSSASTIVAGLFMFM